jgi:signal peptidase I
VGSVIRVLIAGVLALISARKLLVVAVVKGKSMAPTLREGDRVLMVRYPWWVLRRGQIVAIRFPGYPAGQWQGLIEPPAGSDPEWTIKRIVARGGDLIEGERTANRRVPNRHVFVVGDGACSLDSRHWGPLPAEDVLGVMVMRLPDSRSLPLQATARSS